MTKREAFVVVMTMLGETYRVTLTDAMLDGYWLVLEGLGETELKAAARAALARPSGFMPSPGELLAFVRPPRNAAADVINAWQVVRKAIDKYDWNVGSIDFGPLVNAVIRNLGGWDTLCKATLPELDNPGWLRKRFEEVYSLLCTSDSQSLNGEPLAGNLPPLWQDPLHVIVPVDGSEPRKRLEATGANEAKASIDAVIKDLANKKAS